MKQGTKKQLVMIGIRRKGEKGFTINNEKKKKENDLLEGLGWVQAREVKSPLMPMELVHRG